MAAFIATAATFGQAGQEAEITTQETPGFVLRAKRNLVLVRAMVRDKSDRVVGDLKKQDFQLFDNGKAQTISHFSVEHPAKASATQAGTVPSPTTAEPAAPSRGAQPSPAPPQRFLAFLFDDRHAEHSDLNQVSAAAQQYLSTALRPGDRVGIFTTSGHGELDFTNDISELQKAVIHLAARPLRESKPCPPISGYEAYLITEMNDPDAFGVAYEEMIHGCATLPLPGEGGKMMGPALSNYLRAKAREVLVDNEIDARHTFDAINRAVLGLAERPGERTLVLASPGFFDRTVDFALDSVIDRALREGIVVNALNSLGLTTSSVFSAERKVMPSGPALAIAIRIKQEAHDADEEPLIALADGTGGTYFRNNNDFLAGFRSTADVAEVYYLLAFTPSELKYDGKFHKLQVKLANPSGASVQARRGYFAPREAPTETQQAEEQIRDAIFSTAESKSIPMEVSTKFFKRDAATARVTVLVRIDAKALSFLTEQDRKVDLLKVTTVFFDGAGKLVDGKQKVVNLRLQDATLAQVLAAPGGIQSSLEFELGPGSYRLREIVHEANGNKISAINQTLEIP